MEKPTNKYFIGALLLALVFHGTGIFYTLEYTYDALIHLFFADHYATSWFEPWDYRWYTGFTVFGYPPLVHQLIALFSFIGGLKFGLFTVAILSVILFITGVYRFSLLLTAHKKAAGYAALLAAFSSSFVETLHIFGQLPSIIGISVLMHALPEIYLWIRKGRYRYLATSLSLISVTVTSHHVTPIFGMVFFIFPLLGMAVMDTARDRLKSYKEVTFQEFIKSFRSLVKRMVVFGVLSLVLIVGCILPYWINSKNNPITQVPIPHGSRDNFLEVTSSGLVFFLIPWGVILFILPYIFYRYYSKRFLFFGFSISLLTLLGTGGTTPLPKIMLGENAFNILTLDRFTLWASIMALPIFGEFVFRFIEGDLKLLLQNKLGAFAHRILGGLITAAFIFMTIFTMSLGYFRPSQPQKIKMLPIINFLDQDQHDRWRYLTLGFGDQMAWLSAKTNALTVDGNYHSARRLPELTSRAVERLENSKFKGVEGIGSLQQFLTVPEKYHLKYIFSNDKFYDPILYFCGWQRLRQLENGIMVWERLNIPPLPAILPKDEAPVYQKLMWGSIPLATILIAFVLNIQMVWLRIIRSRNLDKANYMNFGINYQRFSKNLLRFSGAWTVLVIAVMAYGMYLFYIRNTSQLSPGNVVKAYYDALDFKEFKKAFSYIDPKSGVNLDQYMLQISVSDGLLSSYAKLDAIEVIPEEVTDNFAKLTAHTYWITPLERIYKEYRIETLKHKNKWYLKPMAVPTDIPPDQFFSNNQTQFYNHGRRRITTQQTHHEDVLKQPVLEVLHARLIKYDTRYAVIGEVQNIDNIPSDVTLTATLYNKSDKKLAAYNAKYHVKHKLLPKETSSFRIDFERIAWVKTSDSVPDTFNPNEFTPVELTELPVKFNLQVAGNVSASDLYKQLNLNHIQQSKNGIEGTLFNGGLQEVTVPQLLISYYDPEKKLIWVDHKFLSEGLRPQRKLSFNFKPKLPNEIEVINDQMDYIFINGLPNDEAPKKLVPIRKKELHWSPLQAWPGKGFEFIKIELNSYIGNPI
ncbi:hypothetical protein [Ascidiimonas aurantiaca]|uniref:hypothetical protein n=1 Tax=Ascidiimonas aurantiaca TaxID=1685432 RepID=UPI0030EE93B8